jgi:hypothetical protein
MAIEGVINISLSKNLEQNNFFVNAFYKGVTIITEGS